VPDLVVKALASGMLHIDTNSKCVYEGLPMTARRQLSWLQTDDVVVAMIVATTS